MTITRSISSLFMLIMLLGLQACGGGGGGGSTPPGDANPTGYYENTGTVTVDDDGAGGGTTAITDLQGMINGSRFMMISDAEGLFYDGRITSISTNDFAANVSIFKHGKPVTNPSATISGTITEKSKIEGKLTGTGAGNSAGMFTLQYANNNDQFADVTRIERNTLLSWARALGGGTNLASFELTSGNISNPSIPNDGTFAGCSIDSGSFVPVSGTSIYTVTMNVTSCTTNPSASLTYTGLGTSSANGWLIIGVTDINSTYGINADFRQFN